MGKIGNARRRAQGQGALLSMLALLAMLWAVLAPHSRPAAAAPNGWSDPPAPPPLPWPAQNPILDSEEVGYLAGAGTLPAARRRGGQGAIMVRRIREALALGCRWLVTETFLDTPEHPNPSLHNMLRTGFQIAYERPNYIYFPE